MNASTLPEETKQKLRRPAGLAIIVIGLALGYVTIYRPLLEAAHTGALHYYVKGILLPPLFVYAGAVVLFTRLKDGDLRRLNSKGKPTFTAKGWWLFAGAFIVMGVFLTAWWLLLRSMGFQAFTG